MKEMIKKTNLYLNYKKTLIIYIITYLIFIILLFTMTRWILNLSKLLFLLPIHFLVITVLLLPFIIYYSYKLIKINLDNNQYNHTSATVIKLKPPIPFLTNYYLVILKINEIDNHLTTKFYSNYKTLPINLKIYSKIDVLVNKANNTLIILNEN
ncbi:MAG: hypothetical protein WC907_00525 [Acholeplasmataceae bacterium]